MLAPRADLNPHDLSTGSVHIWAVRLSASDPVLLQFRSVLCAEELARAERFAFERLRRAFALSRGVLRALLGCYLCCRPEKVEFVYGEKGKPALAGSSRLQFNTSHSGGVALFGLALSQEIGVDVEQLRPMDDMQTVAARFFSPPEISDLNTLPSEARVAGFFRCWTRKEAYIKAIGDGLSCPLDGFRVTFLPGDPPRLTELFPAASGVRVWSLHNLEISEGYAGALAYQGEERRVESQELVDAEQLLRILDSGKE